MMTEIIIHDDVRARLDSMNGNVAAALLMGDPIVAVRRLKHAGKVYQAGDPVPTVGIYGNDWQLCQVGGRQFVTTKTAYEQSLADHAQREQRLEDAVQRNIAARQNTEQTRASDRVADLAKRVKVAKAEITKLRRAELATQKARDAILQTAPQPYEKDYKQYKRDVILPANVEYSAASSKLGKAQGALEPLQADLDAAKKDLAAID